jgi:hypothetical protein
MTGFNPAFGFSRDLGGLQTGTVDRPSSPNPPPWEIRPIHCARFGSPVDAYCRGEGCCICQSFIEDFKPGQFRRNFMSQVGMHLARCVALSE